MARIVNPNTIRPAELRAGDVMIRTVTLHILSDYTDPKGEKLCYRMYLCPYVDPNTENPDDLRSISDGVPQGARMLGQQETARELFNTVVRADIPPDIG